MEKNRVGRIVYSWLIADGDARRITFNLRQESGTEICSMPLSLVLMNGEVL